MLSPPRPVRAWPRGGVPFARKGGGGPNPPPALALRGTTGFTYKGSSVESSSSSEGSGSFIFSSGARTGSSFVFPLIDRYRMVPNIGMSSTTNSQTSFMLESLNSLWIMSITVQIQRAKPATKNKILNGIRVELGGGYLCDAKKVPTVWPN